MQAGARAQVLGRRVIAVGGVWALLGYRAWRAYMIFGREVGGAAEREGGLVVGLGVTVLSRRS